jgi:hypothetical protein
MIDREKCRAMVYRRQCKFRGTEDVPVTVSFNRGRRWPDEEVMLSVCRPHRQVLERDARPMEIVAVAPPDLPWGRTGVTARLRRKGT